jgi:signal peptidase I
MCEVAVPAALPPVPRRLRRETGVFRAGKPCMFGIAAVMVAALCPWRLGVAVGSSMAPTLVSGQPFVYDRGYYRSHPLKRGDVVVMKVGREIWVKRVYAGPGEQFWAFRERDGRSVRTSPVRPADRARFVQVGRNWQRRSRMRYAVVRVALGPEQVFLIGDGAYSFDSRQWGPVAADHVLGRVLGAPGILPVLRQMELSFPARARREQPRLIRSRAAAGRPTSL